MLGSDYFATVVVVGLNNSSQTKEITSLAGLQNLKILWLRNTQVVDLSPLAGLKKLEWLDLGHTQVVELSPLA